MLSRARLQIERSPKMVETSSVGDPQMSHVRHVGVAASAARVVVPAGGGKLGRAAAIGLVAWMLAAPAAFSASNVAAGPAAQLIAEARNGRADVPRVELAARLKAAGLWATADYDSLRADTARELVGRPDGVGAVTAAELAAADRAIARAVALLGGASPPSFCELARAAGRPQIPGLRIVYLNPLGDPAAAHRWRHILAHQTEGPAGAVKSLALAQFANPTKRGVMLWVETDGTVYWATAETAIPTQGDGANRNDNKYIDNGPTYRAVVKTNTIGVELNGNFPDVAKPPTAEQVRTWLILVRFLQERYGIPAERIYAHNWIDYKDARYCEGCKLAKMAREMAYVPGAECGTAAPPR
jgi:hypothetical protein